MTFINKLKEKINDIVLHRINILLYTYIYIDKLHISNANLNNEYNIYI